MNMKNIIFLYGAFCWTAAAVNDIHLSCHTAREVDVPFCDMIEHQAAQAYANANYSRYYPSTPMSSRQQDQEAKKLYWELRGLVKSDRPTCKNSLKRLACAQIFPEYVAVFIVSTPLICSAGVQKLEKRPLAYPTSLHVHSNVNLRKIFVPNHWIAVTSQQVIAWWCFPRDILSYPLKR